MRVILVPVADRPYFANTLRTALDMGQKHGANLCGFHIQAHRHSDVSLPANLGMLADYDAAWETTGKGKRTQKSGGVAPKPTQLATYLCFWGIRAERVCVRGNDDAKGLRKAYQDTQFGLLVMVAYSRNRLRRRVFGGVTEFMLHRANIPVLMLHT